MEDFDTEGFISSSVAASVPNIPEYGRLSDGRGKAGLRQNGILGVPCFDLGIHGVERLAPVALEPESDLPPVGLRGA
jgi:hypothetical protein